MLARAPRRVFRSFRSVPIRFQAFGICAALLCCAGHWSAHAGGVQEGAHRPAATDHVAAEVRRPRAAGASVVQDVAARLVAPDCKALQLDAAPLVALQQLLQPLGLGIRVLGCPLAPAPMNQRVLAVTAVVLDGSKATDTVRGALGDGEPVDMGGSYKPEAWPARGDRATAEAWDDSLTSPDVQFNRRWLRNAMASQGYASVTGPWWAFIPVHKRKR